MNRRHNVAVVGGAATLLASAPLTLIFAGLFSWFLPIVFAVTIVVGIGMGLRTLRAPLPVVVLAQLVGLALFLTWTSASGGAALGVVPTGSTLSDFGALFKDASDTAATATIPVPESPGLIFVAVLGIGVVAILVDLFTIGLRTPALSGVPMLAIYIVPMAVMEDTVPWLMFIPGALGYLWLLLTDNIHRVRRFGRRFAGDGRNIDMWEPSPLASTGRWLTAVGVAVALLLPLAIPGVNAAGLLASFGSGGNGDGDGGSGGEGAVRVNPAMNLRGALTQDKTTNLLNVVTDDPNPGYLRLYVTNEQSDEGWSWGGDFGSGVSMAQVGQRQGYDPNLPGKQYKATVTVLGMRESSLPLYPNPDEVSVGRGWNFDPVTSMATSDSRNTENLVYEFKFTHYQFDEKLLRTAPPVDQGSVIFTENTRVDPIESIQKLAERLTADKPTVYDKVKAVNQYFSPENGFKYSLSTERGTLGTGIEDFLQTKSGYCQQYAASMMMLLRAAHIPARGVIGFTSGTKSQNVVQLTNRNYHAWVEVYFQGYGWVPFDPTPSGNVYGAAEMPWAPDSDTIDRSSNGASEDPQGPRGASGDPSLAGKDPLDPNMEGVLAGDDASAPKGPATWPYWITALVVLAILLAQPGLRRTSLRSRRLRPNGDGTASAHLAWRELQDLLIDYDYQGPPSETPRGTADRLVERPKLTGEAAEGVHVLATAEETARYSVHPPDDETADRLAGAVGAVRAELATHAGRTGRLRIILFPPSVLRAWRAAMSRGVAGTANALARARGRVRRLLTGLIRARGRA
ncbi:hypothetical protein Afil01_01970 [Actinorhabdospora filicis]|uniref:Transglutaminase-like domain-containing protein n=1 Tax=Actinorhabdospora filicis TaxID=1785913 RepID=A0A9W6SG43_9ACTN|nr:DUF3488 and transglutaminase-like domain-containing protein [Actinorhabdospora filicis]GLZ75390.1 hypothetical protein Afil01_01970 [Actinorhabdospora filicis]